MSSPEEIELPRGSYELLTAIVKGFLNAGGEKNPIPTKNVGGYIGRHPTIVSQNIKAIEFMGIVSREGTKYQLTKDGADLAYSIEYNDEQGISSSLKSLVSKNELLKSLVFSVKSRGIVSNYQLRDDIAKRAKVTKKDSKATTGAQAVIDILTASNFLKREGDNLIATEQVGELKEGVAERPLKLEVDRPTISVKKYPPSEELKIPMQIIVRLDFQVPTHPDESSMRDIANTIRKIRHYVEHPPEDEEEE